MPQLDAYVFFTQVFWLLVTFLALFILSNSFFLPRVLGSLVARSTLTSMATTAEPLGWANGLEPLLSALTPQVSAPSTQPSLDSSDLGPVVNEQLLREVRYLYLFTHIYRNLFH